MGGSSSKVDLDPVVPSAKIANEGNKREHPQHKKLSKLDLQVIPGTCGEHERALWFASNRPAYPSRLFASCCIQLHTSMEKDEAFSTLVTHSKRRAIFANFIDSAKSRNYYRDHEKKSRENSGKAFV